MIPWNFPYPGNSGYNYFGETKGLRPRKKYVCVFLAWAVSVCWTIALPGLKSMVKDFLCAVHHSWIVNYCSSLNLCFPSAPTALSTIFFPHCLGEFTLRLEVSIVLLLQGTFSLWVAKKSNLTEWEINSSISWNVYDYELLVSTLLLVSEKETAMKVTAAKHSKWLWYF